jgi:hypothetical protein
MSPELVTTHDPFADLSLKKQQIYRRYANGELTWVEVAEGIEQIHPPSLKMSRKQRIAFIISSVLLAFLIPPWAKRED